MCVFVFHTELAMGDAPAQTYHMHQSENAPLMYDIGAVATSTKAGTTEPLQSAPRKHRKHVGNSFHAVAIVFARVRACVSPFVRARANFRSAIGSDFTLFHSGVLFVCVLGRRAFIFHFVFIIFIDQRARK